MFKFCGLHTGNASCMYKSIVDRKRYVSMLKICKIISQALGSLYGSTSQWASSWLSWAEILACAIRVYPERSRSWNGHPTNCPRASKVVASPSAHQEAPLQVASQEHWNSISFQNLVIPGLNSQILAAQRTSAQNRIIPFIRWLVVYFQLLADFFLLFNTLSNVFH